MLAASGRCRSRRRCRRRPSPGTSRCRRGAAARSCRRVPAAADDHPDGGLDRHPYARPPRSGRPALDELAGPAQRVGWATLAAADRRLRTGTAAVTSSANSSPPSRPSSSPRADQRAQPVGGACSSSSPAAWPRVSLTSLKWSMSSSSRATGWSCVELRAAPRRPVPSSAARLSSPVSGSCMASYDVRARHEPQLVVGRGVVQGGGQRVAEGGEGQLVARLGRAARGSRTRSSPTGTSPTDSAGVSVVLVGSGWTGGARPRRRPVAAGRRGSGAAGRRREPRRSRRARRRTGVSAPVTAAAARVLVELVESRGWPPRAPARPAARRRRAAGGVGLVQQPQRGRQQQQPARVAGDSATTTRPTSTLPTNISSLPCSAASSDLRSAARAAAQRQDASRTGQAGRSAGRRPAASASAGVSGCPSGRPSARRPRRPRRRDGERRGDVQDVDGRTAVAAKIESSIQASPTPTQRGGGQPAGGSEAEADDQGGLAPGDADRPGPTRNRSRASWARAITPDGDAERADGGSGSVTGSGTRAGEPGDREGGRHERSARR